MLCAISYKILGMNIFDSLTHSMTTIATGGFQIIICQLDFLIMFILKFLQ